MDQKIISTKPNDKNQEATFQETIYVLANEVLKIMKELHQEHRHLLNSKDIAEKMFNAESIKNILDENSREGIDSENRVDPLKETVDNILNSFSELLPPSMMDQLSEIKDHHYNKTIPDNSTDRLDTSVNLVKKYIDSISSRINELEDLIHKTTNSLSEMELALSNELFSAQGKFCDDRAFELKVSSDVSVMTQSFDTSSDIETIKKVVFSKIENITKNIEKKKEQDTARLRETEKILEEMSKKMSCIAKEAQAMRKRSLEVEIESLHDNLTQLYNRKAYDKKVEETLANLHRYNVTASLMICDIDYFKEINDNFGHHAGDLTLKKLAQILKENLRKNDFIARYGGDEFICILPHAPMDETRIVAEKLRSYINRSSFTFKGKKVPVTISMGISTIEKRDDATTIFARADTALSLAKHSGKNRVKTGDDVEKAGKKFSYSLIETDFENE